MLQEVSEYYRSRRISPLAFECPHRASCALGAGDFLEAREPLVGDLYVEHVLPRLLFISAEPSSDSTGRSPQERTARAIRAWEERQPRSEQGAGRKFARNSHWYRTYQQAQLLLGPIAEERGLGRVPFQETFRYFAHTDSAKCKDVAEGTPQGPSRRFENCRAFMAGEVEVLAPDIIVCQGKHARDSLAGAFKVLLTGSTPDGDYSAQVIEVTGRPVLRLETHHPNRKDNSYRIEVEFGWPWYATAARVFAGGGTAALARELGFIKGVEPPNPGTSRRAEPKAASTGLSLTPPDQLIGSTHRSLSGRRPPPPGIPVGGSVHTGELVADFRRVAQAAGVSVAPQQIQVQSLLAPHRPPSSLPAGTMAVYVFCRGDDCLKVGKVGPKSQARYTSQHYNPASSMSNLAKSILKTRETMGLDVDESTVGAWIRANVDRYNFILDSALGAPVLTLLEAFLQCRLRPRFEGFESQR